MRSRAVRRPFLCCAFDGFRAAALLNLVFLVLDFGEQVHHAAGILLKVGEFRVDGAI